MFNLLNICFHDVYFLPMYLQRIGRPLGLCKDPIRGSLWAYTSQSVYKYKVTREARDVWQMYLDKEEFEMAKEYCRVSIYTI